MKEALGKLDWGEKETLFADINVVLIALEGKRDLYKEIGKLYFKLKFREPPPPVTPRSFKEFAKTHNEIVKVKKKK